MTLCRDSTRLCAYVWQTETPIHTRSVTRSQRSVVFPRVSLHLSVSVSAQAKMLSCNRSFICEHGDRAHVGAAAGRDSGPSQEGEATQLGEGASVGHGAQPPCLFQRVKVGICVCISCGRSHALHLVTALKVGGRKLLCRTWMSLASVHAC